MLDFAAKAIGVPWVDKGRSFDGWDCWGLIVCLYREVFDIDLKSFETFSCLEGQFKAVREMVREARRWPIVKQGQEKPGDVILFRPLHSGVVYQKGRMIHCLPETETCLERYSGVLYRDRLIGFYRNERLF